jgi:molybdenum cofactor biosynthesis protein B
VNCAILTVSDSRDLDTDGSGNYLSDALSQAGHQIVGRKILADDRYLIRAQVAAWIADESITVIVTTGGTGFTGRDVTPEAVGPLLDKLMDGFGELFRSLSFAEIGASTIQSRALAGVANGTVVFCLPGSTGACRTAFEGIIGSQLDAETKPCNLATLAPRFREQ